jgi:hypothetical protein
MPFAIVASPKRLSSLALRKAALIVASGFSFDPSFISEPFVATKISAALAGKLINSINARKHWGNRFIVNN